MANKQKRTDTNRSSANALPKTTGPWDKQRIVDFRVKLNQDNIVDEYVEIKCQLDATEVFIADLIACSTCFGHQYAHHQELKSIIQWLLRVV